MRASVPGFYSADRAGRHRVDLGADQSGPDSPFKKNMHLCWVFISKVNENG